MLSASINVDDVKHLFLEFQAAGVPFHQTLRKEPWGANTFIVRDPDGNLLLFAEHRASNGGCLRLRGPVKGARENKRG